MATIYFGTNRDINRVRNPDDFTGAFSRDGLANLRFGEAIVEANQVQGVEIYGERNSAPGSKKLFHRLRKRMRREQRDTVIFIHGFNVTFKQALVTAANLSERYRGDNGEPLNVVVFTWPSDGNAAFYQSDRHDARTSGLAFARGLVKTVSFLRELGCAAMCEQRIHLVAHSMGTYVLRHTLQALIDSADELLAPAVPVDGEAGSPIAASVGNLLQRNSLPRLLDQIVLVAADEDDDAFDDRRKLGRLPEMCRRVSIYFNQNDRPLTASDWTKGNPDRLGSQGPRHPHNLHSKIESIDCTRVALGLVEHSYYLENSAVVDDINAVLAGQPAADIEQRRFIAHKLYFRL